MSRVPPELARRGIRRVTSNLGSDQRVVLPKGIIKTLFGKELLRELERRRGLAQGAKPCAKD